MTSKFEIKVDYNLAFLLILSKITEIIRNINIPFLSGDKSRTYENRSVNIKNFLKSSLKKKTHS